MARLPHDEVVIPSRFIFFKDCPAGRAGGRTWDLLVFVNFLPQAASKTTRLLHPPFITYLSYQDRAISFGPLKRQKKCCNSTALMPGRLNYKLVYPLGSTLLVQQTKVSQHELTSASLKYFKLGREFQRLYFQEIELLWTNYES